MTRNPSVNSALWRGATMLITLTLAMGLGLILALALGWNDPRPHSPPDWRAAGLPMELEAAAGETIVQLLDDSAGDATLELQAAFLPGSPLQGCGLIYRAQDASHYYAFAVAADGYYAILRVSDEERRLIEWQQFPHIRRHGQVNRLRATCVGATCRFYINDEYAATVQDDTWLNGQVGLWVRAPEGGTAAVRFLSLQAWQSVERISQQARAAPLERAELTRANTYIQPFGRARYGEPGDAEAGGDGPSGRAWQPPQNESLTDCLRQLGGDTRHGFHNPLPLAIAKEAQLTARQSHT